MKRRRFVRVLSAGAAGFGVLPLRAGGAKGRQEAPLRIGMIGSGRHGGALGLRLAEAGHQILFSSRHPEELAELVERVGPNARAGYPQEAATFGDVVVIAVPYGALPQVGRDYAPLMQGKIVIDCGNPREDRDGPMAAEAIAKGTGVASAEYLPGVRLVRTFSAISYTMVEQEAHRPDPKIGVPIAADDPQAIAVASRLVTDVGFDPVVVGPLSRAREFDRGTPVYVRGMTAAQLREALGLG